MSLYLKLLLTILCCITPAFAQTITTVAGGGSTTLANNVAATSAYLYGPTAIAVDSSGNYFFADCISISGYGCQIYKVTVSTGIITLVAGKASSGYTGDGGAATSATFSNKVYGLTVAPSEISTSVTQVIALFGRLRQPE